MTASRGIRTRRLGQHPNPVIDIRRRLAKQLRAEGHTIPVIAEVFQVSTESIKRYLAHRSAQLAGKNGNIDSPSE